MNYLIGRENFTKINETEGTLQNASKITTIEVSDLQTQNNGLLLPPLGKIILGGDSIYVRCVDGAGAEVRVVHVEAAGEGGGGGGNRPDFALDQTGTDIVENFLFSALEYPNATNPNLDGKTVLVLAVKDANGKSDLVKYIFVDLAKVIDVYSAGDSSILVADGDISVRLSKMPNNALSIADDGLFVNTAVSGGISGHFAMFGTSGVLVDGGLSVADIAASIDAKIDKVGSATAGDFVLFGASGAVVDGGFSFSDVDPSGKIDRVTTAVEGNFAVWSASGMLQDGGVSAANFVAIADFVPFTGATSIAGGASGLVPAPAIGEENYFLRGDGNWVSVSGGGGSGVNYSDFTGATSIAGGTNGLVPAPSGGDQTKFLRGDGTWAVPASSVNPGVILSSITSGVEGALWTANVDGIPMLKLRHGTNEFNFLYDGMVYSGAAASSAESVSPDTYILGTASVSTEGGVWYELNNDFPRLWYHSGNYNYALDYDTITYLGADPHLASHLPFDISPTLDACGNEWNIFGSGTASIGSANAIKGNALQVSGGGYIRTVDKVTFGGADFTLRWHFRVDATTTTYSGMFSAKENLSSDLVSYMAVFISDVKTKLEFCYGNSSGAITASDTVMTNAVGAVHHIELDYFHAISTLKIFVDGQLVKTLNVAIDRVARYLSLGANLFNTSQHIIGTIDEFQLYDGSVMHSANFTPPTASDYQ